MIAFCEIQEYAACNDFAYIRKSVLVRKMKHLTKFNISLLTQYNKPNIKNHRINLYVLVILKSKSWQQQDNIDAKQQLNCI